jgi:hypothetical protein
MINYFKYTSGNAFTLSGVDYNGFVNIDDNKPFTGRVKDSFSVELSSKDNFLSRSILDKREFDNSPTAVTTNKVEKLEYSPRNVLSNDFLKENFNILYKNNLSLYSLSQVYNNSLLDTSNFKDEQVFGGFFGLSSTTIDDRNDDNNTLKNLNIPYQIDPFKGVDESKFPGLPALDSAKQAYVETYEDGVLYTITTDSKSIAFSGCFSGQLEKITNSSANELANVRRLDVDKSNGIIYSPTLERDGLTYTNMYDRDIYRACAKLKLIDRIKVSDFRVINNNISFGKNYKVVQVLDNENNIKLEISPNTTSKILATLPISRLNNAEYVKVESRYTDDLMLIVAKPLSNTQIYNVYFIDISEFILNGAIPEPTVIPRVIFNTTYKPTNKKNSAVTVFGVSTLIPQDEETPSRQAVGYWGPLFRNKSAAREFSLATPKERIVSIDRDGDGVYETNEIFYESDLINFYGEDPVYDRPDGLFIYRSDDSIPDLDISFSDYDSNLFSLTDNGNMTERMITNPSPVISFLDGIDLLLPPDILFNSPYKFNTNNWKFNTNRLESNRVSILNILTDTFKDKTYVYLHNIGRIYYSTNSVNKKRISLVPADLKSFFNPDVFDTICETSIGLNLNVLIQDILRDTINIYNNFTRIPKSRVLTSVISEAERYSVPNPDRRANSISVTAVTEVDGFEPVSRLGMEQMDVTVGATVVMRDELPGTPIRMRTRRTFGTPYFIQLQPNFEFLPSNYDDFKNVGDIGTIKGTPLAFITGSDIESEYFGITDKIVISEAQYNEFRELSKRELVEKYYDIVGRTGVPNIVEWGPAKSTGQDLMGRRNYFEVGESLVNIRRVRTGVTKYYIVVQDTIEEEGDAVRREVSFEEYQEFQKMSREEQLNTYYDGSEPLGDPNLWVTVPRVESGVRVFSDYKIPPPLEIDTRNFYFHSNESVNYLSINRVFSKLFELQKTIYDSIIRS